MVCPGKKLSIPRPARRCKRGNKPGTDFYKAAPPSTFSPRTAPASLSFAISKPAHFRKVLEQIRFCSTLILFQSTMCDDAEVLARGCGHLYDLDIRRCRDAIQNNTTCPPRQRQRVRYSQDDHDGKCKSCAGQSPPDSTWYVVISTIFSVSRAADVNDLHLRTDHS
jgi:hypothetical protein